MNNKKAKKIRKETRKEIRANVGDSIGILSKMVHKRPRWIPKRIWIFVYLPLFPRKYLNIVYQYLD